MNKQTFTDYQLCARPSDAVLVLFVRVERCVYTDAGSRGRKDRGKLGKFSRLISTKVGHLGYLAPDSHQQY